jgi:hypothetical protein
VEWRPLLLLQNVPLISAWFPGGEGIFRMDVGASSGPAGNVIFHTPAVLNMNVDTSVMQVVETGNARMAVGPLDWFRLGSHCFDRPQVLYSLTTSGPLADGSIQGNIGVEFLKPFRLILDYRNARLSLQKVE